METIDNGSSDQELEAPPAAGSFTCPYKLAIIGGGPSGCSIIVRAARIGVISELCSFTYPQTSPESTSNPSALHPTSAGVCLIDAGTPERVGGGRLQDYVINSNTWINKFATNVVEEKPDNLPAETVKNTLFDSLNQSAFTKLFEGFGNKPGPLKMVGSFLHEVGSIALSTLGQYPDSSKGILYTRVQSMHRVVDVNNRFLCWRLVLVSTSTTDSAPTERQEIYAQHVVLATGGYQPVPILSQPSYRSKLVMSDVAVTMEGVDMIKAKLRRHLTAGNINSRIVVIGGSHSAFSAAWICLNLVNEDHPKTGPLDFNNPADIATLKASTYLPSIAITPNDKIRIGPSGICLLHRSAIRVFYATRHDAEHDHYFDPNTMCVNKITGQINTFGGIRGDAKELWKAVRSGRETRMRLLQVKTAMSVTTAATGASNGVKQSIVDKMMDEAAVIIWAGGYASNMPEVYDANGQAIPFSMFKGQVNVDDRAKILLGDTSPLIIGRGVIPPQSSQVIEHLYGSGLGFGLKATLDNGEPDGSSGRADGVAVYLKRGATLILANVLGNKVYGGANISSWEERNQTLRKQSLVTTAVASESTASEGEGVLEGKASSPCRASTAVKSPSRRSLMQLQSPNNTTDAVTTTAAMSPTRVNGLNTNPWSPNGSSNKNRAMSAGRVGINISTAAITVGNNSNSSVRVPSSPTSKNTPAAFPLSPSFRLNRGGSNSSLIVSSPAKKDGVVAAVIVEVIAAEAATAASEASTIIMSRSTSTAELNSTEADASEIEKSSSSLFSQSDGHLSAKLALIKASCDPSTSSLNTATALSTSKKISTSLDLSKAVLKDGMKAAAAAAATASAPVTPSRGNNNNNNNSAPSPSSKKVTPSRASVVVTNKADGGNKQPQQRRASSVGRAIRLSNPKIIPVVSQPTVPQSAADAAKDQGSATNGVIK